MKKMLIFLAFIAISVTLSAQNQPSPPPPPPPVLTPKAVPIDSTLVPVDAIGTPRVKPPRAQPVKGKDNR